MNRKNSRNIKRRSTKRQKLTDQSNELQSSQIFKLPVEMLEYIFDHLPAKDLYSVAKTCKWLQRVAIQCYQQNYSGIVSLFWSGHVWGEASMEIPIGFEVVDVDPGIDHFLTNTIGNVKFKHPSCFKGFYKRSWKFEQLRKLIWIMWCCS